MDEIVEKKIKKLALTKIKLVLFSSIGCFPLFLLTFCLFFVVFFVLGVFDSQAGVGNGGTCVNLPTVDSICKSITVAGHGTMSVDEYVAGVISHEVGGFNDDETFKFFAVAARSYGLAGAKKDSNGNCVISDTSTGFQTFDTNYSDQMLEAAEATSGVILVKDGSVYRSEYDAFCWTKEENGYYYVCQGNGSEDFKVPSSWAHAHVYNSYLNSHNNHHGRGASQFGVYYLATEQNWDYKRMLDYFYGDEGASLASTNSSSSICDHNTTNNGNLQTLSAYNLDHAGLKVLNRTLTESEQRDLNSYIESEVDKAGYGTGEAVAAAGQALVYWLENKGFYLLYYWGGGQGYGDANGVFVGANPNWGSTKFGDDSDTSGIHRIYYGMDCSGFTSWAVRNGCNASSGSRQAASWMPFGSGISLEDAKPGDMLASPTHVQLVVKNNGDGSVIVAEETGGSTSGLVFTQVTKTSSKVVDMSNWYKNNCAKSR